MIHHDDLRPVVWDASSVFFANASASIVEICVPSNRTIVSGKTGFFVSFAVENTTDMNVIAKAVFSMKAVFMFILFHGAREVTANCRKDSLCIIKS